MSTSTTKPTSAKGLFLKLNPAQRLETIYDTLEDILVRLREHSTLLQKIYSQVQEETFSDSDLDGLSEEEEIWVPPKKKSKKNPLGQTQEIPCPTNQTQEMEED